MTIRAPGKQATCINKKVIRKTSYKLVTDVERELLVRCIVDDELSIIEAAGIVGVPYENAKAIYRVYRMEGRLTKKKNYGNKGERRLQEFLRLNGREYLEDGT